MSWGVALLLVRAVFVPDGLRTVAALTAFVDADVYPPYDDLFHLKLV